MVGRLVGKEARGVLKMDSLSHVVNREDCKFFIRLMKALNPEKTVSRKVKMFNETTINSRFVETAFRRTNSFVFDDTVNYQLASILFWKLDMIDATNTYEMIGSNFFHEYNRKKLVTTVKNETIKAYIHSESDKENVYYCIAKLLRLLKSLCVGSTIVSLIDDLIKDYNIGLGNDFALNLTVFKTEIDTTELSKKKLKGLSNDDQIIEEVNRRKLIRNKDGFKIRLFLYVFFMNYLKEISKFNKDSKMEEYSDIAEDIFVKLIFSRPFSFYFYSKLLKVDADYQIDNGFQFVSGNSDEGFSINDKTEDRSECLPFNKKLIEFSSVLISFVKDKKGFRLDSEQYRLLRYYLPKCFSNVKIDDDNLKMIMNYFIDFLLIYGYIVIKPNDLLSLNQKNNFESYFLDYILQRAEFENPIKDP